LSLPETRREPVMAAARKSGDHVSRVARCSSHLSRGKCPQHNSKTMNPPAMERLTNPRWTVARHMLTKGFKFLIVRSIRRHRALRWRNLGDNAQPLQDRVLAQDEHRGPGLRSCSSRRRYACRSSRRTARFDQQNRITSQDSLAS